MSDILKTLIKMQSIHADRGPKFERVRRTQFALGEMLGVLDGLVMDTVLETEYGS